MNGQPQILAALVDLLIDERSAVQQYLAHEAFFRDRGYVAFADIIAKRGEKENEHSNELLARIYLLGGSPDMSAVRGVTVGISAPSILENDLRAELQAVEKYNAAISLAIVAGDFATSALLQHIVIEENEHAREIEALISQMNDMTFSNFMSTMTGR